MFEKLKLHRKEITVILLYTLAFISALQALSTMNELYSVEFVIWFISGIFYEEMFLKSQKEETV